ncbi:MAG: hypothetical protein ACTSO7_07400 [Candidatus Heimdallarchaeota archaeon]
MKLKTERVFTIVSIATFIALLPALIIMEVRLLRETPEVTWIFVIIDILLICFIGLEVYLTIRKYRKEKKLETEEGEEPEEEKEEINKEWDNAEEGKQTK